MEFQQPNTDFSESSTHLDGSDREQPAFSLSEYALPTFMHGFSAPTSGTEPFLVPSQNHVRRKPQSENTIDTASKSQSCQQQPQLPRVVSSPLTYSTLPLAPAERRYKCDKCFERFVEHRQLVNHHQNKHKRYVCLTSGCHAVYRQYKSLWRHQQEKHNRVRYNCDICTYSSGRDWNVRRHKINKHGK